MKGRPSLAASRALLLLAASAAVLAPAIHAQVETFRGQARVVEVQVPVNVTDRDSRPVRDLTADQFVLLDDGEPQQVTGFEVVDLDLLTPSQERVMDIDYGIPGAARRHVLFLFDLSFSSPTALARARRAAQDFALEGLHPSDLAAVAVHSVESGLQLLLTFTPDRAQLARAIVTMGNPRLLRLAVRDPLRFLLDNPIGDPAQAARDIGGVTQEVRAMEASVSGYLQVIGNQMAQVERSYARGQISSWARSMRETARVLASVDGRKQVVWFSEGFDGRLLLGRQPDFFDPEYQREQRAIEDGALFLVDNDNRFGSTPLQNDMVLMLNEFRRANCVIQAVDISGLRADLPSEDRVRRVGRDALFYVANETGGQLYEDANDFGRELGKALETSTVTYLLSFQPSRYRGAGEHHRLRVKVPGVKGAKVSHRMGYHEARPFAELHPIEKNLLAADLIATATVESELDVSVLTAPFRATEDRAYLPVIIEIGGAGLLVEHETSRLPVELYAYATDEAGEMKSFFTQLVSLDLDGRKQALAGTGLKYYGHLFLGPGRHLLRVLARNAETGRTGSRTVEVQIPRYEEGQPQLLPPFFMEEPGRWFLVRERSEGEGPSTIYPFTVNGEPFVPAASPLVGADEQAELCLMAYNLGHGALDLGATVRAEDGNAVAGGAIELRERTVTGIEGLDKLVATFEASGLEAGRYTLEVEVTDPQTRTRHLNSIPLTVLD